MSPGISTRSVFLPLTAGEKHIDMRLSVRHSTMTFVSVFGNHQQHFVAGYWMSHQSPKFNDQICSPSIFFFFLKKPPLLSLHAPVRCQVPTIALVNIGNDSVRRLNHLHWGLAKEFALVVNKLAPEATIGPDDRPSSLYPGVCLS